MFCGGEGGGGLLRRWSFLSFLMPLPTPEIVPPFEANLRRTSSVDTESRTPMMVWHGPGATMTVGHAGYLLGFRMHQVAPPAFLDLVNGSEVRNHEADLATFMIQTRRTCRQRVCLCHDGSQMTPRASRCFASKLIHQTHPALQ